MAPKTYDATGIEHFSIPAFTFSTGETIPITIAYRSFNPSAKHTVLIPTCFSGRINNTLNFTTTALSDAHVLVVAMLGNGESSSPSNTPSFPKRMQYSDSINAQYALLQHLGIHSLHAVIGYSMGGQIAYYWAVMHCSSPDSPPFAQNIISICSSAKTSAHNIAFVEGPIAALTSSIDYVDGRYKERNVLPQVGLRAFGRSCAAWLTSAEWFRRELWTETGCSSLAEWLDGEGEDGTDWDPEDLLVLARMWQDGDVGKVGAGGDWREALKGVKARVLVMPSRSDQYFTPDQSVREVGYLQKGELAIIDTVWGHIAGGGGNKDDTAFMEERIGKFLSEGVYKSAVITNERK